MRTVRGTEHGYLGVAPGAYTLRRQREQADEERLVAYPRFPI